MRVARLSAPRWLEAAGRNADRYRWWALGITTFTQAASVAVTGAIGPLAALLQADFGIEKAQVGLITTSIYLSATAAALIGGRAADQVGERQVLIVSALVAGLATLVAAAIGPYWGFLFACFFIGFGTGIQNPAGSAAIIRWFPQRRRGFAMGIRQTGVPFGGILAATVWPVVALAWGWRASFAFAGLVALIGAALIFLAYRDPIRAPGTESGGPRSLGDIVRDRRLWLLALTYNGQIVAQFSANVYFVLFLQEWLGLPLPFAASLLAAVNLVAIGGRIGWGALSDLRFGGARRPVLLIIIGLTLAGLIGAAILPRDAPAALAILLAAVLGVSAFSWTGIYGTLVIETAGRNSAATAVAWVHVLGGAGSLFGPPLFGLIVDRTGTFQPAWIFAAVAVAVGLVATWRVRERGHTAPPGVTATRAP